jgi:N-acetylmuramoyl-L-alanine amidase
MSRRKDSARYGANPGPRQYAIAFALVSTLAALPGLQACNAPASGSDTDKEAGFSSPSDVARARAITEAPAPLPPRTDVLALAGSIEDRAAREGAGPRATALHATAARLLERLWRVEGREQDAKEAVEQYEAASRDTAAPGSCDAAFAGARLMGDVRRSGAETYAELYRVERRFSPSWQTDAGGPPPCRAAVEDALALLAPFRPPTAILDAIDDGLASEGAIARPAGPRAPVAPAGPPQVLRVESWSGRDAARVVVVVDRPAVYRVGDEVPARGAPYTFLDLDGVELGATPTDIPAQGIVTRVRAAATSTGCRLWLDLDGPAWRRVFELHEPYRIIVDVARHPPGMERTDTRALARMVLDPGHGGSDRGARGPNGLEEKDVVLDIAHRVAPALASQGIQVVLTRDDDHFVSLEERTARANAFGADLFVSIHCNASEGRGRRGVETYVLDTTRDEIASRVAARENETSQAASAELASILGGMRMADESRRSKRFAQLLLRASTTALQSKYGDALDGGVHAAGFYVLVGARMPAVLFETNYISSAVEEQRLATVAYRQLFADAIVNAVRAYREGR